MTVLMAILLQAGVQMPPETPVQPSAQVVAQAVDRCMTTYAVRLTKTDASDEAIFAEATRSCAPLTKRLNAAIAAEVPAAQAADISGKLAASAKPNCMALLAKIRSDRAARAQQ